MSEVAGLSLGVVGAVPALVSAFRCYRKVYQKLHDFRHLNRELRYYRIKIKFQRQIFSNECHILLQLVTKDTEVTSLMVSDPEDRRWKESALDEALREVLQDSYQPWVDAVEEVYNVLEKLNGDLARYDKLAARQEKVRR